MTQFKLKCSLLETTTLSLRESIGESDESAEATVSAFWFSNDIHLWDIFFWAETAELESWHKIKTEIRLKTRYIVEFKTKTKFQAFADIMNSSEHRP